MIAPLVLANNVRIAAGVINALNAAGIGEEDPDFIEMLEAETDVLKAIGRLVRESQMVAGYATACRERIAEIKAKQERWEGQNEQFRATALWALQELGLTKLVAEDFTASVRAGSSKIVGEPEPDKLPDHLCIVKRSPDRVAIRKALEAGTTIEGLSLSNGGSVLSVRVR